MKRVALGVAFALLAACSSPRAQSPGTATGTTGQAKGRPDISAREAARIPPAPPVGLHYITKGGRTILSWTPSRIDTVAGYRVYRKIGDGKYQLLGDADAPTFVDHKAPKGAAYSVTVKTTTGVESPLSDPAIKKPQPAAAKK